jgi:peptide/nickel transport system substrate-binding protein
LVGITALELNAADPNTPALKDPRVRQALNYALDRKSIVRGLLGKYGAPTSEIITSDANPGLENYYPYNPKKAKSLLAAAGYAGGFTLKIIDIANTAANFDPMVQAAAKYLNQVGVQTDITSATIPTWLAQHKNFGAFYIGTSANTTPTRYGIYLAPNASFNVNGNDPKVPSLYWSAYKAKDPYQTWKQMWAYITRQGYYLPIALTPVLYYSTKKISGISVTTPRIGTPLFTEWTMK